MAVEQLKQQYKFWYKAFSLKGNRPVNEDRVKVIDHGWQLLLLADGMGGYKNGDTAADLAITSIEIFFRSSTLAINERILDAFKVANSLIRNQAPGAGATMAGVCIEDMSINIFWSGDVRVYVKDVDTDFRFVTKDHTLAQIMRDSKILIKPSEIDRLENTVTRGLGFDDDLALPEIAILETKKEMKGMICSDGFHNLFGDDEIFLMLDHFADASFIASLENRVSQSSRDNASLIMFHIDLTK